MSRIPDPALTARVDSQESGPQLDKVSLSERADRGIKVKLEQPQQGIVADVSGSHDEQLPGCTVDKVPVAKVSILGDHHPVLAVCRFDDLGVGGRVPVGQIAGVECVAWPALFRNTASRSGS